jgi:AcrR family transcriptional regulator
MKDQTASLSSLAKTRTEPVQQRSSERITLLLDTAAALIDEKGIDGLTTSDVAARSHSSVGVVYRYFPNIQTLLRALAARNMQRFIDATFPTFDDPDAAWLSELDRVIDAYVDMARNEPGFRALHFGGIIDERSMEGHVDSNLELAARFTQIMAGRYDIEPSEQLALDLDVAIEITGSLLQRAFRVDRAGDERYFDKARQVVRLILEPYQASLPAR